MSQNDLFKLDKKRQSQLDPGGVLRSAHDDLSQTIRVVNGITEVPSSYSRVDLTYNAAGSVTRAVFYEGTQANITELIAISDSSGSLNNKYIIISSENNESRYYLWFNVGGLGTDPNVSGAIGIEVQIDTNDSAKIVALAMSLSLKHITDFCIQLCDQKLFVENSRKGYSDAIADFGTGFVITTTQQGSERLLKAIDIPFDNGIRYSFNEEDKRFEIQSGVNSDGSTNVNIVNSPSFNENTIITFNEISAVTSSTLTTIATYTVPLLKTGYLQRVESGGENMAVYQVEINSTIEAKRRTYFGGAFTTDFVFAESTENGVLLNAGDVVTIRVEHSRPMSADFEARIQVLEIG